ncbi:MAG: Eco57I restriction-modification methylase domain-containing protein [Promethearchaeota archaeon]
MNKELNHKFFKNLKAWITLISNIDFNSDERTKMELIVFLINKLIYIQTLAELGIIESLWLKNRWKFFERRWHSKNKFTVLNKFFEQIEHLFHEYYDANAFKRNILDYVDEKEDNIATFYKNLQLVLGLNNTQNSSNTFRGIMQYNYQYMSEDIFGRVYESCLAKIRHDKGIYYTPAYIVEFIVENTVGEMFDKLLAEIKLQLKKENFEEVKRLTQKFMSIKVLDPSCGSGSFLIKAFHVIQKKYSLLNQLIKKVDEDYYRRQATHHKQGEVKINWVKKVLGTENKHELILKIFVRHIFGTDLDKTALNIAKFNFWLEIIKLAPFQFRFNQLRKNVNDILPAFEMNFVHGNAIVGLPDTHVIEFFKQKNSPICHLFEIRSSYLADFKNSRCLENIEGIKSSLRKELDERFQKYLKNLKLASDILKETYPLHWALEFWHVFFDQRGLPLEDEESGFDVVIGNPPYIDSETMTRSQPEMREYINKVGYKSASGNWDIFCIFIERELLLARQGGIVGKIIPNKFLAAEYALEIQKIIEKYTLEKIRDYSRVKVFEKEISVYPIVIVINKSSPKSSDTVQIEVMKETEKKEPVLSFKNQITLETLRKLPKGLWSPLVRKNFLIVQKVLNLSDFLPEHGEIFGAATVSEAYRIKDILEDASSNEFGDDYLAFVNTGTIDRYGILWGIVPTKYIKKTYSKPIVRRNDLRMISVKRLNESISHKIIIAGISLRLEAFYDQGNFLAGKSTVLVFSKDMDLSFLTACINSKLISFVYRELFESLSLHGGYLRIGPPQISRIPIRRINFSTKQDVRKDLVEEAQQLYQECLVTKNYTSLHDFVEKRLPKDKEGQFVIEDEESDVIYDILSYLAERTMEMNKQKNEEIKAFLRWLEREIGTKIETMTNRAKLIKYCDLNFDEFLGILIKNEKKITTNLSDREVQDRLKKKFEKSLAILSSLRNRLKITDELIDQIFYKLYGLTHSEIAKVEATIQ